MVGGGGTSSRLAALKARSTRNLRPAAPACDAVPACESVAACDSVAVCDSPPPLWDRTAGTLAAEVWRSRHVTSFEWEAPAGWREDDVTAAAFLAPSSADQVPVPAPWHPDTRAIVEANASEVRHTVEAPSVVPSPRTVPACVLPRGV